jgi:hypothetical protein
MVGWAPTAGPATYSRPLTITGVVMNASNGWVTADQSGPHAVSPQPRASKPPIRPLFCVY